MRPPAVSDSDVLTSSRPATSCLFGAQAVPATGLPHVGIGVLPYGYNAPQGQDVVCTFALSDDSVTDDGEVIQARLPIVQEGSHPAAPAVDTKRAGG